MHKTVTITLGEQLFTIEEDAYKKLEAYLASVRAHFAQSPDQGEIVSDIESRIAEEFAETLTARKKVVGMKDVEDVMKSMGSVEDFERFEEEPGEEKTQPKQQPWNTRLYRSADDQMLGGVCAGLAAHTGIETWIVRVVFIILGFINGIGIIAYIILWVVLPEAKSATQKVEMARNRVTLSAIQQKVNEVMPPEKRDGILRKIVSVPATIIRTVFLAIGRVVKFVVPLLARLIGLGIIMGAAFAIAMITIALLTLIANPSSILDFPLRETVGVMNYFVLICSLFLLLLFPLIFVIVAGASLVTLRSAFSANATIALFTLWCVALVAGGATAFSVSPDLETAFERYEQEHFKTITNTFPDYKDFTKIDAKGRGNIIITQGDSYSVSIEGPADETDMIGTINGALTFEPHSGQKRCFFFCGYRQSTLRVTMPTLDEVKVSGVSFATIEGYTGSTLNLIADGSSSIVANAQVRSLTAEISGVSDIVLTGSGNELKASLTGNSSLSAYYFAAKTADVTLEGVSRAHIDASEKIFGTTDGHAHLWYRNTPAQLDVESDGLSTVEQRSEDWEGDYR
jgi:phage shock protein PspC (stress-responsive transcriptional regulator)